MTRASGGRAVGAAELKALFRQLVRAFGGVDAAGVELGVSGERISQKQRADHEALPSVLEIVQLEAVLGRAIVTGALARAAEGAASGPAEAMGQSAVDGVGAAAALALKVHAMDADGHRDAGEIREVQGDAAKLAREGVEALIAASALTPGPVPANGAGQ